MILDFKGICQYYKNGIWITMPEHPKCETDICRELCWHLTTDNDNCLDITLEVSAIRDIWEEFNKDMESPWELNRFIKEMTFEVYTLQEYRDYIDAQAKYMKEVVKSNAESLLHELESLWQGNENEFRIVYIVW